MFRFPESSLSSTAMNRNHTYVSTVLGALLLLGSFAQAQKENTEPLELTRLREQFQARVNQELIPWRDKYKKELQKLEDRFIQERRLTEALAVKTERDYGGGLSSKPPEAALKVPESTAELKKFLKDKVWLVYSAEDKGRETIVDVYRFVEDDKVYCLSGKKKFQFSVSSTKSISIAEPNGNINLEMDLGKGQANADHLGKKYQFVLANYQ